MTWERGRDRVDKLLAGGELEEVTASEALASRLVAEAEKSTSQRLSKSSR